MTAARLASNTDQLVAEIIAAWSAWHLHTCAEPVPEPLAGQIARRVRLLLVTGYSQAEARWALSCWTMAHQDHSGLAPEALDRLAWRWARDTRSGARRWRTEVRAWIEAES